MPVGAPAASDPTWLLYLDGRPFTINVPVSGYSVSEWCQGGIELAERVFTAESWQQARDAVRRVRRSGRPVFNIDISTHVRDSDELRHFLVNYSPVWDSCGQMEAVQGVGRDITEFKRASIALQDSEARLRSLIENSPDLILAYYYDGRPPFVSRAVCGFGMRDWRDGGLPFFRDLNTPESLRRFDKSEDYVRSAAERVIDLRLELRSSSGGPRSFLTSLVPLLDERQDVVGVQAVMHDITELAAAQLALRESESRFYDIIETAHDLVWSTDREGRWTYLNQATRLIYGYAPEEMLGRHFSEIMHPDHVKTDLEVFRRVLDGRDTVQHETVHLYSDGSTRYLSFNIKPRMDRDWNIIGAMGTARDITEQKLYQTRLEHLAEHDALTGLFNRHYFEQELERAVGLTRRELCQYGLLYVDLDNFKYVNDTLGHAAGDQLLLELARLLEARVRQGDVLARFGGDEFTILVNDMSAERLCHVAESFNALFKGYTYLQREQVFDVRVSIGAALIDQHVVSASEALAQADVACGIAKTRGRNQSHVYNPADQAMDTMITDVGWSRKINEALDKDLFHLLFQPIICLHDGRIEHHEVLLRMRDGDRLIAPGAFLSQAERFGLIHAIDRWVVEQAITRLAGINRGNPHQHRFAINLSGRAFEDPELLPTIRRVLEATGLDPSLLTFEVTETAAISHINDARLFIEDLKSLNCRFALDDFGSGFSSYGYLKSLPADYLKIDGGFVQHLARDPVDQSIVQSMNQVAHALGKQTIAEFVEDAQTLTLLRHYGVDYAQGYYLGMPAEAPVTRG